MKTALYLYEAHWGSHGGCCWEPGDSGYYSFITTADEETMKERMRAAAEELGDAYKHHEFLKAQTDGFGFDTEDGLDQKFGDWKFAAEIVLDEIKREDLWSQKKMTEIIAERERKAAQEREAQRRKEREAQERRDKEAIRRLKKERPEMFNEIAAED